MKRGLSFLLCFLLLALSLSGCQRTEQSAEPVSMYDLSRAMLAAADFDEMTYVSSADENAADLFSYVSDIDYDTVASFFLAYAKDGKGNADEVCVIALKNPADVMAAKASVQKHLEKRIRLYATYDPTQSEKVENGIVRDFQQYVCLIVSDDNRAVETAFHQFISES